MAQQAFQRCRACGEPVVSGAFRCPVCGLDFPEGAPSGAGAAARGSRATSSTGNAPRGTDALAARLRGALDQELGIGGTTDPRAGPREPDPEGSDGETRADPSEDQFEPAEPGSPVDDDFSRSERASRLHEDRHSPHVDVWAGDGRNDDDPDEGDDEDSEADAAPDEPRQRDADRDPGVADLTLAPAADRPGRKTRRKARAKARRERVEPTRKRSTKARSRARRSKAGSLVLTLVMAVLLLGLTGGAAILLDLSGRVDLGLVASRGSDPVPRQPGEATVSAGDGWVRVPLDGEDVTVTADGPYRVRVGGEVYSLEAGRTIKIPAASGAALEVRAASASTVARVTPSE